ncbi:MAG: HpcH/HpaI aldolase/citrate lyase family protein, partial [Terriglobia bacterium]
LRIVPAVETAAGMLAAAEVAKGPRVESLGFGIVDFVRDIGVEPDPSGMQTLWGQSYVVMVSRAAGLIPPVASVHAQIRDNEGLRATSEAAKHLGFFGRSCLHPVQIPVVHEVFTPSPAKVEEARAIVNAFERAKAQGSGALAMENGEFVDKPVAERAQALIELAEGLRKSSQRARNS